MRLTHPQTVPTGTPDALRINSVNDNQPRRATSLEADLDSLAAVSPDLLGMTSLPAATWVRVNPAFTRMLGWEQEEMLRTAFREYVHPADRERVNLALAKAERSQSPVALQHRMLCKGGGHRWISWHVAPCTDNGTLCWIGRNAAHTRRTVHALRTANYRIQRANANLEHFVSVAGHDLQEPLRTVSMYSNLLLRRHGNEMPPDSAEPLQLMAGATKRMQALLDDLLAYAHSSQEPGKHGKAFEIMPLQNSYDEAIHGLQSSIHESSATITHDALPFVFGDQMQLCQLLQNLFSNAIKYRRPGVPPQIHLGVEEKCDERLFHVTDNGRGFDPDCADRIFLPFKRLHGRDIPGTGLGLAICQMIVERHGGRIWAESRPGEGATFWFTLPGIPSEPE